MSKYCRVLTDDYVSRMRKEGVPANTPLSGPWLCVCASLALPGSKKEESYNIATKFAALYALIDSYIDDPHISEGSKQDLSEWLIDTHTRSPPEGIDCGNLLRIRGELELLHANASEWLSSLAECTVRCYRVQCDKNSSERVLLEACTAKGGETLLTLYRLIYGHEDTSVRALGSCMQMLDDIVDCTRDRRDDVFTYCTYVLKRHGSLDTCADLLISMLLNLDSKYVLLSSLMFTALRYTVIKSHNFTTRIRTKLGLCPSVRKSVSFIVLGEDIVIVTLLDLVVFTSSIRLSADYLLVYVPLSFVS